MTAPTITIAVPHPVVSLRYDTVHTCLGWHAGLAALHCGLSVPRDEVEEYDAANYPTADWCGTCAVRKGELR